MHCLHALEAVSFHVANLIFSASVLGIHCHQFWCLQKSHLLQKSYHRLGLPECISVCKLHTLTNCIRTRGYASLTCSRLYFPTDPLEAGPFLHSNFQIYIMGLKRQVYFILLKIILESMQFLQCCTFLTIFLKIQCAHG